MHGNPGEWRIIQVSACHSTGGSDQEMSQQTQSKNLIVISAVANFRAKNCLEEDLCEVADDTSSLDHEEEKDRQGHQGSEWAGAVPPSLVPGHCFPCSSLSQALTIECCAGGLLTFCVRAINAHALEMPGLRLIVLEMVIFRDLISGSAEWYRARDLTAECSRLHTADADIFQTNQWRDLCDAHKLLCNNYG